MSGLISVSLESTFQPCRTSETAFYWIWKRFGFVCVSKTKPNESMTVPVAVVGLTEPSSRLRGVHSMRKITSRFSKWTVTRWVRNRHQRSSHGHQTLCITQGNWNNTNDADKWDELSLSPRGIMVQEFTITSHTWIVGEQMSRTGVFSLPKCRENKNRGKQCEVPVDIRRGGICSSRTARKYDLPVFTN